MKMTNPCRSVCAFVPERKYLSRLHPVRVRPDQILRLSAAQLTPPLWPRGRASFRDSFGSRTAIPQSQVDRHEKRRDRNQNSRRMINGPHRWPTTSAAS